jgi:very-short-patch-repair endonuclease
VQRLVRSGRWTRLLSGIYLSAEAPVTWFTWAHVGVLMGGPGAVLLGESAAALRALVPQTLPVWVAIPTGRRCRRSAPNVRVFRVDVPARDRVMVQGLPSTSRLRTAVDVAHLMPLVRAQPIVDRMLVRGQVDLAELTATVTASRRVGSASARRLMRSANDLAAAESERMARRLFREAGITGWVANHPVRVLGGSTLKVDLALPRLRIAVEVKGWVFHSESDRATNDDQRVSDLGIAGWIVIPVGWLQLKTDPTGVVARVQAAIDARRAEAS